MKFTPAEDPAQIEAFRRALYSRFTAPLDGMWESLYIGSSQVLLIELGGKAIGYCCIDDSKSLTQFFLSDPHRKATSAALQSLIATEAISSAKLSSIEPISFNACLALSSSINSNTYCYQYDSAPTLEELDLQVADMEDVAELKAFFKEQIGFDDNFGYTENLIQRKELHMHRGAEGLLATGECRLSDTQDGVADVGMIVNQSLRSRGLGRQMLHSLAQKAMGLGRSPICSTTIDNVASQKAIAKAGFYCSHIIFDIDFSKG